MIRILFVCLGNICRSPMAEFVFKEMVKKQGKDSEFYVESAATSNETAGQPVHFGTRKKLSEIGISTEGKYARQLKQSDYDRFDYIIGMEEYNINCIKRIVGDDNENKVYRLLDFSDNPRDIADPWYTNNFDITYNDIVEGCTALLKKLI